MNLLRVPARTHLSPIPHDANCKWLSEFYGEFALRESSPPLSIRDQVIVLEFSAGELENQRQAGLPLQYLDGVETTPQNISESTPAPSQMWAGPPSKFVF